MQHIDSCLVRGVFTNTGADILVKRGVGEAEIVLVGLAAKSVCGHLLDEIFGQIQKKTDLKNLSDGQLAKGRKVTRIVAVARGITNVVLAPVAGEVSPQWKQLADTVVIEDVSR